jgi:hypothetical protein
MQLQTDFSSLQSRISVKGKCAMLFLMTATSKSTKFCLRLCSGCRSEFVEVIEIGWDIPKDFSYVTSV